jgi:phenylalanyl-tRNA synthetase beta chain
LIVSLKWLKDYIDIDDLTVDEIVDKLTTSGSEVDEVIDKGKELENIVVGYVEEVKKHPNADRLSVCKVTDGTETYDVVCGAPNVAENQKVAFAKVGAIIPNGKFEIKKAKIRGEKSMGMICAEDELGISDDHEGILILDENIKVGEPISKVLKLDDVVLDIAITPNRADSLSHIGLARDLAALFKRKLKYPTLSDSDNTLNNNKLANVEVLDGEKCPRYSAIVVKDVTVKESPNWLKEKLTSIGLRPINNIVDVTNFVLYEIGQPLHAFDLNKLIGQKIIVKTAGEKSKFVTLDSKERSMLPDDLMIYDAEKPVAIAGVMGGENSEVTDSTKDIVIESAYFDPSSVRKTAKHLGLSTDASYRFERGTDPSVTIKAAQRAATLIAELSGGTIDESFIDVYPKVIEKRKVEIRYARIAKILGFEIPNEKVVEIFEGLEFSIVEKETDRLTVEIPTFRHDIEREIDLIEEVVRIYGFDGVPPIQHISIDLNKKVDELDFEDKLKNTLTALGFNEVVSNSLISDEKTLNYDKSIKVLNPQSSEMSLLRTSLIPGMLMNISRNIKIKEDSLKFFEIGEVFELKNKEIISFDDFSENENLILAITGKKNDKSWYQENQEYDFFDLTGLLDEMLNKNSLDSQITDTYYQDGNNLFEFYSEKHYKKQQIGIGGKVKKELLSKFEITQDVFLFELNVGKLKEIKIKNQKYKQLLKYPKVLRDFAFVLDKNIPFEEVVKTIKNSSSVLLKNVKLFDIFESDSLGEGKKSLAFQLEYYDFDRTLREDEIDKEFWKTIENVKQKLKAELRG